MQAADAAYVRFLEEVGESESGAGPALCVLQFLPGSWQTAGDASDGGGNQRSCVDVAGASANSLNDASDQLGYGLVISV